MNSPGAQGATVEHGAAAEHGDVCGACAKGTRMLWLTQKKVGKKKEKKEKISLTEIRSQSRLFHNLSQMWLSPGLWESESVPFSCRL